MPSSVMPTIQGAAEQIRRRELSPVELTDSVLARLDATEDKVHAYVTLVADQAREQARVAEQELASGTWRGPLHGIPVSLKDIILTAGVPTSAGSDVMAGFVPSADSSVAEMLKVAGAILIGKTVTHEFAYGQNVVQTRNPWNLEYYSGGSSAGAAVSVAVGSAMGAIGTDTGGSLRLPASMCGVSAIKPTFGRVSKRGVVPLSNTMDHCGPMAKTVADLAILLSAIAGFDARDRASARRPVPDFSASLDQGVKGMRLGVARSYYFGPDLSLDAEVGDAVNTALATFENQGAEVVDVTIPHLDHAAAAGELIILVEASAHHQAWLRRHPERYHPRTRLRLEVGELVLATDYLRAQQLRHLLSQSMRRVYDEQRLDALIAPTQGTTAMPIADLPTLRAPSPDSLRLPRLPYTVPFNLTGQPSVTVPCGFSTDGLPIGMQIAGRPFDEPTALRIAQSYQDATEWHLRQPSFASKVEVRQ